MIELKQGTGSAIDAPAAVALEDLEPDLSGDPGPGRSPAAGPRAVAVSALELPSLAIESLVGERLDVGGTEIVPLPPDPIPVDPVAPVPLLPDRDGRALLQLLKPAPPPSPHGGSHDLGADLQAEMSTDQGPARLEPGVDGLVQHGREARAAGGRPAYAATEPAGGGRCGWRWVWPAEGRSSLRVSWFGHRGGMNGGVTVHPPTEGPADRRSCRNWLQGARFRNLAKAASLSLPYMLPVQ